MRWSDEITLIGVKLPDGQTDATDENGFPLQLEEAKTTVFANKKSVGFNEFFKARQAGYTAHLKFDVFTEEYDGQPFAEYNGKRFKILRTYIFTNTSGDYTELTLSDLSERGGAGGGVV
jgi:hypothetical protein